MSDPPERGPTRELATWAVESDLAVAGHDVRAEASRTLLNWIGCAVGGSDDDAVRTALDALGPFSGPPGASLLGRRERLDPLHAALLNGIGSHVFDYDDTHIETAVHPGGPVLAAILALAEHRPCTGAAFADALIAGVEVEIRVARCVQPAHYDDGWHITGTVGGIGAAAAASRLLGLPPPQAAQAMGIAATQAAGFREMFGSMCKSLHVGRAAQGGLAAALLAASGFTSSEQSLEAPRGFAHVLAGTRDLDQLTAGLGRNLEILRNSYKPFPCGLVVHPAIDACLQLQAEHRFEPDAIAAVRLGVHPLVPDLCGIRAPGDELEGKFSIFHAAAVALVRGRAGMDEFSDEGVTDPAVVSMRERVSFEVREGLARTQVEVELELRDGERIFKRLEHVLGGLERPLSDQAIADKVHDLCDRLLGAEKTAALIDRCRDLDSLEDAAAVARAAVPH